MGRAVVTERDVREWRTRQGQEIPEEAVRQARIETQRRKAQQEERQRQAQQEERQIGEEGWLEEEEPEPEPEPEPVPVPVEQERDESRHYLPSETVFYGPIPSSLPVSAPPPADDYVDRLLKYIPAESVALYLTLQGIILSGAGEAPNLNAWLWFIFGIGLIGTALYQWRVLKIGKVVQLAVSTAAFGVWVFALGGAFASLSWYEPFIGSLMLVIFTFFAPLISPDVLHTEQE
jgi:hypothetical protein